MFSAVRTPEIPLTWPRSLGVSFLTAEVDGARAMFALYKLEPLKLCSLCSVVRNSSSLATQGMKYQVREQFRGLLLVSSHTD